MFLIFILMYIGVIILYRMFLEIFFVMFIFSFLKVFGGILKKFMIFLLFKVLDMKLML